jgi:hypothetical protein
MGNDKVGFLNYFMYYRLSAFLALKIIVSNPFIDLMYRWLN